MGGLAIDRIRIDFIEKGDKIILHEVKKSKKMERSHIFQLLYYLYDLKLKGIPAEGVINYPLLRRTESLQLTSENQRELETVLEAIREIVGLKNPPKPEKKNYCRKCSYLMKVNFYLTKTGKLVRKENTVYFMSKERRFLLPINKIHTIYVYGKVSVTSGVLSYLAKNGVCIHFFNSYGFFEGSFYPRETLVSGEVLVRQAEHYLDNEKRLELAREILAASFDNIRKNLQYYKVEDKAEKIGELKKNLENADTIPRLMNVEGNVWETYYSSFDEILPEKFKFEKRTRRPPENMVNCLVSFANSLVYSLTLSEIYNTQLSPAISFLHEPFERRFSLSLDLSEIFKPFLGDRTIFKLLNKGILNEDHFRREVNYCLLNDEGKRIFLKDFDERLKTTIKHRSLGKNVSYQRLVRLECYKLIKHFLGVQKYKAFRMWW
jgi:CRISPR-associated protein Cas1